MTAPVDRRTIAAIVKAAGLGKKPKLRPGEKIIRGVLYYRRPLCDKFGKAVMKDGQPQWEWAPRHTVANKESGK